MMNGDERGVASGVVLPGERAPNLTWDAGSEGDLMTTLEAGLRLAAGLGLGAVIGMERQWRRGDPARRAQRPRAQHRRHQVSVVAELIAEQRNDSHLEQAVSRLSLEPAVTAVTWTVRTDPDNTTDDPPGGAPTAHTATKNWRFRSPVTPNHTPSHAARLEPRTGYHQRVLASGCFRWFHEEA